MAIASINPATGETIRVFQPLTAEEIDRKIETSWSAFLAWRKTTFAERARLLVRAAAVLEAEVERLALLITTEMGRPIRPARDEILKCARACRFYAEQGERMLSEAACPDAPTRAVVRFDPIGPVLAIMPWNFPFWQVFRFAAPSLMAGNTGVLKHASNVPQCALAIEDVFRRAGFPEGVFTTLLIGSDAVGALIGDRRIRAVTLTGSDKAGAEVAGRAGCEIKKTVLELGGSDPFIVMPSASLDKAVQTAVKARTINTGQSCIAAKRFIAHETVYDDFERLFVERMRALRAGDPLDETMDLGPLATPQILSDLEDQVRRATEAGARVLTGGRRIGDVGNFFEPTVLARVDRSSAVYREEIFGPVAMLFRARDVDQAVEIANDTPFGLGCSVWTREEAEQRRFAAGIEAGQVFFNAMVASDPAVPFGGVKRSGYGRELSSFGIHEFVNVKSVVFSE